MTPPGRPRGERIADPNSLELTTAWEEEWKTDLLAAATDRLRRQVDPELFQLFDFHVRRGWPAAKVARKLGVTTAQVYFAKYKVSKLLKREVKLLTEALS